MCAGVGKSGSPMARERIFFPWHHDSAMRSLMRTVGEGSMERTRLAKRAMGAGMRKNRKGFTAPAIRPGTVRHFTQLIFFFQAEDGIRDYKVTGVQTCALPI